MFKNILIIILILIIYVLITEDSQAKNKNQLCDIQTITTKSIDNNGKTIKIKSEEKVVCDDRQKTFYENVGLAKSCEFFYWQMPLGSSNIKKRSIVCKTSEGHYEIIQNFNSID